jgi:pimeloyl-ACP methyl ester carboxylesterase
MAEGYAPPPSPLLSSLELVRAMAEMTTLPGAAPILAQAPRGDGHPVLVFPGFTATDDSTWVLRRYLQRLGYEPMPWELGRNLGGGSNGNLRALLNQRLIDAFESSNERKVSLVGWSLGGVYARALARRNPDLVRQVITLGSPFGGSPRSTTVYLLFEQVSAQPIQQIEKAPAIDPEPVPGVPCTAVYSRTDGVVAWPIAMERNGPLAENIEVFGSHCGLGFNPAVLYAVADRLAQPEDAWRPFERTGWKRLAFGSAQPFVEAA